MLIDHYLRLICRRKFKRKIIGRDGRNKALFETIGGVDLIVDRNDTILSISSPNPIRREIAKRVISKTN